MAVIYNCKYCGKEIKSNMVFEGNLSDFEKWVEKKIDELSEKCKCRRKVGGGSDNP